ncbi:tripartite tricarboxylate transporter substrate binding protein [Xylophilus rhododendri]|uniref:Tripartite tricarboxylate transporter substrate binding protein n=1 Tax=Xylophilus rhododendri TaxID=2697032 RepID=A0A857J2X0_9BURK|nr:tripartite tricarboxylate transporter substrate binding protein [Xylophilus rhododendri]QHI97479.1 tripartite tricarboxylate transporter substrate binding protein [Xylophilus rhododendri]
MHRRTLLRASALAAATSAAGLARAQNYPSRPITLIVPYAAGGNADFVARLFADALGRNIGQAVVVDNKAGGGGAIGAMQVIGSRPDGHTLLFSATSVFSVTPHLVKVGYGLHSARPVCLVSKTPMVLVVRKSSKYKTLADLLQGAKASPGGIPMGYGGLGTPNHLAMLMLEGIAGVQFNGVPYKGSGPMLQDMLAGQIELAADQYSTSRPYIESGDLLPLAVFGQRMAALPDVPSISSIGKEPYDVSTFLGLAAPLATPDAVVATVQKAAAKALEDAGFVASMAKLGAAVQPGQAADYERLLQGENEFIRQMVAAGRIRPE